jgi:hypothetical protein
LFKKTGGNDFYNPTLAGDLEPINDDTVRNSRCARRRAGSVREGTDPLKEPFRRRLTDGFTGDCFRTRLPCGLRPLTPPHPAQPAESALAEAHIE